MRRKNLKPRVFFNASVILSGLHSPSGGSGKLLALVKQKQISGIISEIILDEVLRHADKIGLKKTTVEKRILSLFTPVYPAPKHEFVQKYMYIVLDQGDAHVLASSHKTNADFLVTLDKKHLLILQNKMKATNIVSP
ncbi:putative toxin-antitoxin system toxin component, PIN family, partial [Candidatus Gottesmanbacteria bacterium RIFCSPLOWO2_01_FULL_46_9]